MIVILMLCVKIPMVPTTALAMLATVEMEQNAVS